MLLSCPTCSLLPPSAEHMFFATAERIAAVRRMIAAEELMEGEGSSAADALAALKVFQREDFEGIFEAMDGLPGGCSGGVRDRAGSAWSRKRQTNGVRAQVKGLGTEGPPAWQAGTLTTQAPASGPPTPAVTIRLLDPPLHEFLPHEGTAELDALCDALATEMKGRSGQREWRAHALQRAPTPPAASCGAERSWPPAAGPTVPDDKALGVIPLPNTYPNPTPSHPAAHWPADMNAVRILKSKIHGLQEANPMLGLRGCRLGIRHPGEGPPTPWCPASLPCALQPAVRLGWPQPSLPPALPCLLRTQPPQSCPPAPSPPLAPAPRHH